MYMIDKVYGDQPLRNEKNARRPPQLPAEPLAVKRHSC